MSGWEESARWMDSDRATSLRVTSRKSYWHTVTLASAKPPCSRSDYSSGVYQRGFKSISCEKSRRSGFGLVRA